MSMVSLMTQCDGGIDAACAASRQEARELRNEEKYESHTNEGGRVKRTDTEQLRLNQTAQCRRAESAKGHADNRRYGGLNQDDGRLG